MADRHSIAGTRTRGARSSETLLSALRRPSSVVNLWFAILAPHVAWTVHLLLSYALVSVACATGWGVLLLHATTLATILLSAFAGFVALRAWQETASDRGAVRGRATGYKRYMALAGMLVSAFYTYVIVMEGLPNFVVGPCWGLPPR